MVESQDISSPKFVKKNSFLPNQAQLDWFEKVFFYRIVKTERLQRLLYFSLKIVTK